MIKTIIIRTFMALALLASGPLASVAAACGDGHDAPMMAGMHEDHDMDNMGNMQDVTGCHGDCMETLACEHKSVAAPVTLAASPLTAKFIAATPVILAFVTSPSPPHKVLSTAKLSIPPNPSLHAHSVSFLI